MGLNGEAFVKVKDTRRENCLKRDCVCAFNTNAIKINYIHKMKTFFSYFRQVDPPPPPPLFFAIIKPTSKKKGEYIPSL